MTRLEFVRFVILTAKEKVATWEDGHAMCPLCDALGFAVSYGWVIKSDRPIRYHRCDQCLQNYKSVERIDPVDLPVVPPKEVPVVIVPTMTIDDAPRKRKTPVKRTRRLT